MALKTVLVIFFIPQLVFKSHDFQRMFKLFSESIFIKETFSATTSKLLKIRIHTSLYMKCGNKITSSKFLYFFSAVEVNCNKMYPTVVNCKH